MNKEFDTLANYTTIAKKTISKFAPKFYSGLSKEMLNNDETVAEIAGAIMMADWTWDKNRKGKTTGMGKSMYSYRNQCAIWAIKTYITSKYKQGQKQDKYIKHILEQPSKIPPNPAEEFIQKEEKENLIKDMKDLINSAPISEKQRRQLQMYYYDNKTLAQMF